MAKPWKEVVSSAQYQSMPPDQQAAAQEQYVYEVVAPPPKQLIRLMLLVSSSSLPIQPQQLNTMCQRKKTQLGALVVPVMATARGLAKVYESPVMRNALRRLTNTPKGSTAYDRNISSVTQAITKGLQAAHQESQ